MNRTRLRTHFAARFGKAESDDGDTTLFSQSGWIVISWV